MDAGIFREYDIRGTVPDKLSEETVYRLGLGIGTYYGNNNVRKVSVGRDCRLSSPALRDYLTQGLLETGLEIVDLGMVPTPLLYFSICRLKLDGGVQITGSHNPPEFNGFKICVGEHSIHGDEIQAVREIIEKGDFIRGEGSIEEFQIDAAYLDYVEENISTGPFAGRIVVDAGNGAGGPVACKLYKRLGFEVVPIFCEPDGRFPNHHPDPTVPQNLAEMIKRVKSESALLGLAFDGDADRLGVVDGEGNIIWGDQLMIIFARDLLKRHPGAKIIGEVKCSQVLYDDIERHGGKAIMWKAGHSLIKSKMKEEGALLAGEMSGHLFFKERYLGYDDAFYAGARLLEIISGSGVKVSKLLSGIPQMVNTPEIRVECPDDEKFDVVKEIARDFKKDYPVIDVDGARVIFDGGWGLIRASNTQPVLVLRFEATDKKRLEEIKEIFTERLSRTSCRISL